MNSSYETVLGKPEGMTDRVCNTYISLRASPLMWISRACLSCVKMYKHMDPVYFSLCTYLLCTGPDTSGNDVTRPSLSYGNPCQGLFESSDVIFDAFMEFNPV